MLGIVACPLVLFLLSIYLHVKEHEQKLVMLSRFWLLSEWGAWVNLLKKENLWHKSFSDNVECSKKL